jgi:hypothetical protein
MLCRMEMQLQLKPLIAVHGAEGRYLTRRHERRSRRNRAFRPQRRKLIMCKLILILAVLAGVAVPMAMPTHAGPCNNAVGRWIC